jgi:hypothetical protein
MTGGRFNIFVDESKGSQSLGTKKVVVLIRARQRNIVPKSGRDGRIVGGEIVLRAQLRICMSGPDNSALMLSLFLFEMLSILAKPLGDWVGRRLRRQG